MHFANVSVDKEEKLDKVFKKLMKIFLKIKGYFYGCFLLTG